MNLLNDLQGNHSFSSLMFFSKRKNLLSKYSTMIDCNDDSACNAILNYVFPSLGIVTGLLVCVKSNPDFPISASRSYSRVWHQTPGSAQPASLPAPDHNYSLLVNLFTPHSRLFRIFPKCRRCRAWTLLHPLTRPPCISHSTLSHDLSRYFWVYPAAASINDIIHIPS